MCEVTRELKLCSCSAGEKIEIIHNKNSRQHKKYMDEQYLRRIVWTLDRYVGEHYLGMDGMMRAPADKLDDIFTAEYVKDELNRRNCFDFDYIPNEGDYLVMRYNLTKKKAKGRELHYTPFIHRAGKWTIDRHSGFHIKTEEIHHGQLKFE
jgi:hypothetical protein